MGKDSNETCPSQSVMCGLSQTTGSKWRCKNCTACSSRSACATLPTTSRGHWALFPMQADPMRYFYGITVRARDSQKHGACHVGLLIAAAVAVRRVTSDENPLVGKFCRSSNPAAACTGSTFLQGLLNTFNATALPVSSITTDAHSMSMWSKTPGHSGVGDNGRLAVRYSAYGMGLAGDP